MNELIGTITGSITLTGEISGGAAGDPYTGAYQVTPQTYHPVVLSTKLKVMTDDVIVHKIPQYEVANTQGGETLIIGEEYYHGN